MGMSGGHHLTDIYYLFILFLFSKDGIYLATGGAEGTVTVYTSFNLAVSIVEIQGNKRIKLSQNV